MAAMESRRVRVELAADYEHLCVHAKVLLLFDAAWASVGQLIAAALAAMQAPAALIDEVALYVDDFVVGDDQPLKVLRDDERCVIRRYGFHVKQHIGLVGAAPAGERGDGERGDGGRLKRMRQPIVIAPAADGGDGELIAHDPVASPTKPGGTLSKRARKRARKRELASADAPASGEAALRRGGMEGGAPAALASGSHVRFDGDAVLANAPVSEQARSSEKQAIAPSSLPPRSPGSSARKAKVKAGATRHKGAAVPQANWPREHTSSPFSPPSLRPHAMPTQPSSAGPSSGAAPAWPPFYPLPLSLPPSTAADSSPALSRGRGRGALAAAMHLPPADGTTSGRSPARTLPPSGTGQLPPPPPQQQPPAVAAVHTSAWESLPALERSPLVGDRLAFRAVVRSCLAGGLPTLSAFKEASVEEVAGKRLTLSGRATDLAELRAGEQATDEAEGFPFGNGDALSRHAALIRVEVYADDLIDLRLLSGAQPPGRATRAPAAAPQAPEGLAAPQPQPAVGTPAVRRLSGGYDKRASIRAQLEFYFSAKNLSGDAFMREQIDRADAEAGGGKGEGYVPLALLGTFSRIARMGLEEAALAEALDGSELLELSADRTAVRARRPAGPTLPRD